DVMDWVEELRAGSRDVLGYGYELRWERVRNRVHGSNEVPVAAVFPTEEDGLRFIGRQKEAERAEGWAKLIVARHPALHHWVVRRRMAVVLHADDCDRLLAVLDWFVANPRRGL